MCNVTYIKNEKVIDIFVKKDVLYICNKLVEGVLFCNMMHKKVLPFEESIISFSPNMDHFLSVLENQHNITFPWILENYIDLIIRKDESNPPVFEFLDYNKIWWTCPFVHVSRIERQAFEVFGNLQETITALLERDFYLFFLVDTYYIENYITYKKEHVVHDIFVYGFEEEYVYASDYFDFRYKKREKVSFNSLIEGYQKMPKTWDYGRGVVLFKNEQIANNITLFQYKESMGGQLDVEKVGYQMDRNLVKNKLRRFLDSPVYVNCVTPTIFDYRLGYTTGFAVFEVLRKSMTNEGEVTPKDMHLVCCHVKLMLERVKYLMQIEPDKELKMLEGEFEKNLYEIDIIKKMCIKEMLIEKRNTEKIILRFDYFLDMYKNALEKLCEFL